MLISCFVFLNARRLHHSWIHPLKSTACHHGRIAGTRATWPPHTPAQCCPSLSLETRCGFWDRLHHCRLGTCHVRKSKHEHRKIIFFFVGDPHRSEKLQPSSIVRICHTPETFSMKPRLPKIFCDSGVPNAHGFVTGCEQQWTCVFIKGHIKYPVRLTAEQCKVPGTTIEVFTTVSVKKGNSVMGWRAGSQWRSVFSLSKCHCRSVSSSWSFLVYFLFFHPPLILQDGL